MRREWSGWIKTRQWSEFEKLAKSDPSQSLTDTVAELELGFPEKPDRRALRKILFLLAQAGYEPTEIEELFSDPVPTVPLSVAFMVSPDGVGDTAFTIGRENRGRISWLIVHVTHIDGITRAIEDTTTLDEAQNRLLRLRTLHPAPSLSTEVPVDFALARLAKAVSVTKNLPHVVAYWRAVLPKEFSTQHPAEELPRSAPVLDDLRQVIGNIGPMHYWRLELGSLAPALEEFLRSHAQEAVSEDVNDPEWWNKVLAPDREKLFTPDVMEDHRTRLFDLAYVMHQKGESDFSLVLAIADDLKINGPHSSYAQWMTSKTLVLLFETLERDNAKERST